MSSRARYVRAALLGLLMGFGLSRIGFADFGEVHRMFTFQDSRLLLTFAGAVMLTAVGLRILAPVWVRPRSIHKGTVVGAILFGIGWAFTGACPAIAVVQLGEGRVPALATLSGILLGTWLYPKVHAKFFRWDVGSCDS